MASEPQELSAKDRVLAVWPDCELVNFGNGKFYIYRHNAIAVSGYGDRAPLFFPSEQEAWDAAASKLPRAEEDPEVGFEEFWASRKVYQGSDAVAYRVLQGLARYIWVAARKFKGGQQ